MRSRIRRFPGAMSHRIRVCHFVCGPGQVKSAPKRSEDLGFFAPPRWHSAWRDARLKCVKWNASYNMPAWAWVARSRGQYSLGRLAWPAQKRACELFLSEPIEPHDLGAFAGLRGFVSFWRSRRRGGWNGD